MEEFTIYYGTPEGKDIKIGVDCKYPRRIKIQKISDVQILEVHTCVYEVSKREQELQRQYGVRVDNTPYYVTYFANRTEEKRRSATEWQIGREAINKGIPHLDETKQKIREAHLGVPKSEEHKLKLSKSTKGIPKLKVTCPHCNKQGGTGVMNRWHFDNCKHKRYE